MFTIIINTIIKVIPFKTNYEQDLRTRSELRKKGNSVRAKKEEKEC